MEFEVPTVNLNETFRGKTIASVLQRSDGSVILNTTEGFRLILKPSFDVEYNDPERLELDGKEESKE